MSKGAYDNAPPESARPAWTFAARFRRGAFGWKSDLANQRLKEAVSKIRAVARKDPTLAAEGAARLVKKLSPAFESVDDSCGRLQGVIRQACGVLVHLIACDVLAPLIGSAGVPSKARQRWVERLWQSVLGDEMP